VLHAFKCRLNTVCYLVNCSPSKAIDCKTPYDVWSSTFVDYLFLKTFGCHGYCHVNDGKLEPRSKKCIFVAYGDRVKGYSFWCSDPKSPNFIVSRDVVFDESTMLHPIKESIVSTGRPEGSKVLSSQRVQDGTRDQPVKDGHGCNSDNDDPQEEQDTSIATGRQIRQIN
jgi:hypothetical protein